MIKIVEAITKKQMKTFATFPIKLYKGNKNYVPSILGDEVNLLDPKKNLMMGESRVRCFLAYKDGKLVGRTAGIIPVAGNRKNNEKVLRISRIDFINDIEVCKALIRTLKEWAIKEGLDTISGPWGFNDTDREGMLTYGFDQKSTYATAYSHQYYVSFFEEMGFVKESEWIEYQFNYKNSDPKFHEHAEKLRKEGRFVDLCETMPLRKIINNYGDSFFDCYNAAYKDLDNFVKIDGDQKTQTLKQFATIINKKFFSCVVDKEANKVVAFGVGLPYIGNCLRRAKGRMLFAALPIFCTIQHPKNIELALIGVLPEYANLGTHAIVVDRFLKNFTKYKIKNVWMDPVLTTNLKMHQTWKGMDKSIRQRRQTWNIPVSKIK